MNKILSFLAVLVTSISLEAATTNEVGTVATQSDVETRLPKNDTNYGSGYIDWGGGTIYVRESSGGYYYSYMSPGDIGAYMYDYNYGYDRMVSLYEVNTSVDYMYHAISSLSSDVYYMQDSISSLYNYVMDRPTYSEVNSSIYYSIDASDNHFREQVAAAAPIDASNPTFKQQVNLATDATDVHFSNEVLAVGLRFDVHVIEEINELTRRGSFSSNCWVVVDDYFQNNDVIKSVLKERTGKSGEFGTGWGYMLYNWTSDMRTWLLYVPELSMSNVVSTVRQNKYVTLVDSEGASGTATMLNISTHPLLTDVFQYSADDTVADLVKTDDKYVLQETNGCAYVTYDIGSVTMPHGRFFNTRVGDVSVTGSVFSISASLAATNTSYVTVEEGEALFEDHRIPFILTNVITNIVPFVSGTTSGFGYDVTSTAVFTSPYIQGGSQTVTWTSHPTFVTGFSHTTGVLVPVPVTKVRMATVNTAHYYWDSVIRRTWEIKISNGCIYSEVISEENLTERE